MKKPLFTKVLFGAAIIGLTFFTSCKDEEKSETPATQNTTQNNTQTNNANQSTQEADQGTVEVNPEHGLPGHRCDLPVGAPLNSSTSTQNNQTNTSNNTSSNASPIRLDKTPTVNPPHGEPGHDCAVPVGAPLD